MWIVKLATRAATPSVRGLLLQLRRHTVMNNCSNQMRCLSLASLYANFNPGLDIPRDEGLTSLVRAPLASLWPSSTPLSEVVQVLKSIDCSPDGAFALPGELATKTVGDWLAMSPHAAAERFPWLHSRLSQDITTSLIMSIIGCYGTPEFWSKGRRDCGVTVWQHVVSTPTLSRWACDASASAALSSVSGSLLSGFNSVVAAAVKAGTPNPNAILSALVLATLSHGDVLGARNLCDAISKGRYGQGCHLNGGVVSVVLQALANSQPPQVKAAVVLFDKLRLGVYGPNSTLTLTDINAVMKAYCSSFPVNYEDTWTLFQKLDSGAFASISPDSTSIQYALIALRMFRDSHVADAMRIFNKTATGGYGTTVTVTQGIVEAMMRLLSADGSAGVGFCEGIYSRVARGEFGRGVRLTTPLLTAVVSAFARCNPPLIKPADRLVQSMYKGVFPGCLPDSETINALLLAYSHGHNQPASARAVLRIFNRCYEGGYGPLAVIDAKIVTTVMTVLSCCGQGAEARALFLRMERGEFGEQCQPTTATLTAALKCVDTVDGLRLLLQRLAEFGGNLKPTAVTLTDAISACGRLQAIDVALEMLPCLIHAGARLNERHIATLQTAFVGYDAARMVLAVTAAHEAKAVTKAFTDHRRV